MMEELENETMSMNKCDRCKKVFNEHEWGKLNRHKKLSHDLPCTNCNLVFVDDLDLKKHLRDNHGVGVTPRYAGANCFAYQCRKCLKNSQSIASNIKHEQLEHPHKCKVCIAKQVAYPFSFINSNDLKTHKLKMHNGEMEEAISMKSFEKEASVNAKDTDDSVVVVAVMPKLIKEKKFHHIKLECLPKDSNCSYYESCEIDENANKLEENATNQCKTEELEHPTNNVIQYNHKCNRLADIKDSGDDPKPLKESPLGPEEPIIQTYNLKLEFDMLEEKSTPAKDDSDGHLRTQPQTIVCENEKSLLMGGLWNQDVLVLNENPPANIKEPGRGSVRVRGGIVKSRGKPKPDEVNHTSGLKVIIPNTREELHEMHSVPIYIPDGAVSNTGPDGKVSYIFPFNSQLQNPTMVRLDRLVNLSSLISSTPDAQAVKTPRKTLLPLSVGTSPIVRSPIAGTFAMGMTSPGGREASADRKSMTASPSRPGRASPVRATGPLETSCMRGDGPPPLGGGTGVRMRGAPGGSLVKGRIPMRLGAPSFQGGPVRSHMRRMRTRMPMGRGSTGMRGAPGRLTMGPRMEGGASGMLGAPGGPHVRGMRPMMAMGLLVTTGMRGGAPEGSYVRGMQMERGSTMLRGAPERSLQRGMRPRMQNGRGATGMRPMGRGAPGMRGVRLLRGAKGYRPFSPEDLLLNVVRADFPPAPERKKIKVEITLSSDEETTLSSFEESPPPNPANPALDRLKHCGISVSPQKAPTFHNGLSLPSGISLSQVPSGYSVNNMAQRRSDVQRHSDVQSHSDVQRHSVEQRPSDVHRHNVAQRPTDVREMGIAGSSSFLPATEEPAKAPETQVDSRLNRTLDLDTLTPEQMHQLKMMGII